MLVAPSGPASPERIDLGIEILTSWGLCPVLAPGAMSRHGYLAGSDEVRLAGLNAALRDPSVRGLICTRGGYGAQRIVDGLDYAAVRADPKVLAGFSDITALQVALWKHTGLAGVYGPMAAWNADRTSSFSADSLRTALMTTEPVVLTTRPDEETGPLVVAGPPVTGTLIGGNLCLLAATVGTRDMPDLSGTILLLEEIEEPPYKVDRMLTHLRRCGALDGVVGVAVGQFTNCSDGWPTTIVDVLHDRLGDLGIPVLGGLPVGHGRDQQSVPVGVRATLDTQSATLTTDPAVAPHP
jgi:muramoyltetrapeptide carboxypeptidase